MSSETTFSPSVRVAVLRTLLDEVNAELNAARGAAQDEYKAKRAEGVKTVEVTLPGGAKVGTVSIRDGARTVTVDEDALLAHVKATAPTEVVERVDPAVLADPEVVAWVLAHRPQMVREQVRPAYAKKVTADLDDAGDLINTSTGEVVHLAEVRIAGPSGDFSYRPAKDARERVLEAWRAGELGELGGMFAVLPEGGGGDE